MQSVADLTDLINSDALHSTRKKGYVSTLKILKIGFYDVITLILYTIAS